MKAETEDYYLLVGDKEEGPFGLNQLRIMVSNGELTPEAKVSCRGWANWLELGDVFAVHNPVPPVARKDWSTEASPVLKPTAFGHPLFVLGTLVLIAGCFLVVGAWASESFVEGVDALRIVNIGKVADRQLLMLSGIAGILLGGLLNIMGIMVFIGEEISGKLRSGAKGDL